MKPRIVIIDTNVLVSGLLTCEPDAPTAQIVDGILAARFPFLLSVALLAEYRAVLLRPRVRRLHGLTAQEVDAVLETIAEHGVVRQPACGDLAPDPGDQHLFDLLASEPGAALVTGDRRLVDEPPPGTAVLSPPDFVSQVT